MSSFKFLFYSILMIVLSGCINTYQTTPSTTYFKPNYKKVTPLKRYFKYTNRVLSKNKSAFYPLANPYDALSARLFLIDHAQKNIDVQYYIYENDYIGKLFSAHLLMAANRGVKVRILLDDISTTRKDKALATLAQHPNITLKLFNPNKLRSTFRNLALLLDINTLGKRMHNKALIVDSYASIIGGRNIGDVYFASNKNTLFIDYDILAINKVVKDISKSFELYWQSPQSLPSKDVFGNIDISKNYQKLSHQLYRFLNDFKKSNLAEELKKSNFYRQAIQHKIYFTVAKSTHLYYDHPNKVITDENDNSFHISKQIDASLKVVHHSVFIISPYFIPSDKLMKKLKKLRESNIDITIITNSLASTDVFAVYSGYKSYIKSLVSMGVKLYELKPNSLYKLKEANKLPKTIKASLHTKMIIIDNDKLIVGSANIDPRSDKLNTELVLIIESKKLATSQKHILTSLMKLDVLYRVRWKKFPPDSDGDVFSGPLWQSTQNHNTKSYQYPPKAPLWKKLGADIISLLPIKGYL